MDFVLVSIAGLSLFLAIAMGAILFTVLRDDRRRSDARVAALAVAAAAIDLPLAADDREASPAPEASPIRGPGELFAAPAEPSPWLRRLGVAAALALVVGAAGYVLLPARAAQPAPAAAQQPPLELLTLTHAQQPSGLTISGTVYNPRGGAPVSQVFAAVVLFGPEGNFLTSARAPVDVATVAPGQESPFVISVPVSATVARYRVGFRTADGSVLAHVDRRTDGTAAENAPAGSTPWVPSRN